VQQALQSSHIVSTASLSARASKLGDEPSQLHHIIDIVESHLRQAQEETVQATQALAQVQGDLVGQRSNVEQENLSLQANWDEEKEQLQQSEEQLLVEKLEVKEMVHRELSSVTVVEVKTEE
jgi:hypothetical protein